MRYTRIVITLAVIMSFTSSLLAESYWHLNLEDGSKPESERERRIREDPEYKYYEDDMTYGYFMALVPGFFVHGAGHMYAGKAKTGMILFGMEALSIVIGFPAGLYLAFNSDPDTEGYFIFYSMFAVWLGTWFYDVLKVGSAIKERHPARFGLNIESKYDDNLARDYGENIYLTLSFRF